MSTPATVDIEWVQDVLGADVTVVGGLRDGGSPWLLAAGDRKVVLRVGRSGAVDLLRVESRALEFAAAARVPVARTVATGLDRDPPLLLVEAVDGRSTIPVETPVARLRALGAAAAQVHRIVVPDEVDLPRRSRPISSVDFARLRAEAPPQPLLVAGERALRARRRLASTGRHLVHGDLWQGNALWRSEHSDALVALIDWDCAGVGPPGVDLGSLRCDAAVCFGTGAADHVLSGWEDEAGQAARGVAYWDIVAALSTPPDMGWFAGAIAGQGRPDLRREVLVARRDAFLRSALDRI